MAQSTRVSARVTLRRSALALCAVTMVALGLGVHFLVPGVTVGLLADGLYTVMVYLVLAFLAPRARRVWIAVAALSFSVAVELFQLTDVPAQLAQAFPPSRLVLGTTFSALDLAAYAVGAVIVLMLDTTVSGRVWTRSAQHPHQKRARLVTQMDNCAESKDAMRIDLHTHSNQSDGSDTPGELIEQAVAAGLDVVALTDHDTVAGWSEATEAGKRLGITVVCGIEFSTSNDGRGQHLLGYNLDPCHPSIAEILERGATSREDRVLALFAKLDELGLSIDREYVTSLAGGIVSRKHVAAGLVKKGHVDSDDEAFARYLNEDGPAYIQRYEPCIEDTILAIRGAGGVSVIAHPATANVGLAFLRIALLSCATRVWTVSRSIISSIRPKCAPNCGGSRPTLDSLRPARVITTEIVRPITTSVATSPMSQLQKCCSDQPSMVA